MSMSNKEVICVCKYVENGETVYLRLFDDDSDKAFDYAIKCFENLDNCDKWRYTYSVERGRFMYDSNYNILKMLSTTALLGAINNYSYTYYKNLRLKRSK